MRKHLVLHQCIEHVTVPFVIVAREDRVFADANALRHRLFFSNAIPVTTLLFFLFFFLLRHSL